MHMKLWAAEGLFGSIVALTLIYYILKPDTFASSYGTVLGWSTVIAFLLLMAQGFWSRRGHVGLSAGGKRGDGVSYQLALSQWGGMHTAMSIVVTIFLIVHGYLLLPGLREPSLALWLGAVAFLILLLLSFSGLMTEGARRSRRFGSLKKLHALLVLIVLVLVVLHVEGEASILSLRMILPGIIAGLAATLFVWIIIPLTVQLTYRSTLEK